MLAPSPAQQPHAHAQMQAQPWGGQAGGTPTGRDFYGDAGYGRAGAPGYGSADGRHGGEGAYGGGNGGPQTYGGGAPGAEPYGGGSGGASYPGEAPYGGGMQGPGAYGYGNAGAPAGDYGGTAAPAGAYGHAGGHHGLDDPRRPAEQAYGGAANLTTDFGGLNMSSGGSYAQPAAAAAQPHELYDHSAAWQRAAQAQKAYAAASGNTAQNPNPYPQPAHPPAPAPQAPAPAAPASWQQYMAPDGRPYFHCRATGASQWERPASMA